MTEGQARRAEVAHNLQVAAKALDVALGAVVNAHNQLAAAQREEFRTRKPYEEARKAYGEVFGAEETPAA